MSKKENIEASQTVDGILKRKENILKMKSKSLISADKEIEEPNEEIDNDNRSNSNDKKGRCKSQKLKIKIKRQASLEEQFPVAGVGKEDHESFEKETADEIEESTKSQEKVLQFFEDLKMPKLEILKKNGVGDNFTLKEYSILSPKSSKLRERFSKSKFLKQDSKNLNVELSKSSDSGIGVSRSTEDESLKTSESVIFRFFDIGADTRLSRRQGSTSDSERSPNFLDTVNLFTRSRSQERSVSSDSSDKNLSDIDKPSIKIRKRHEYSESRDLSSSHEGGIFDAHISNRVRKLHEVALKQMSEESAKSLKFESQKRSVEFKYPTEFGSYDSIPGKVPPPLSKARKFKSLERTDSNGRPSESPLDSEEQNSGAEGGQGKLKNRKKQDRFMKRLSLKDKKGESNGESPLSADKKKEKRYRGFLKSRKEVAGDESDDNVEGTTRGSEILEKDVAAKRLSRKDKKTTRKAKRALSEEHKGNRKDRSLLSYMTGGKRRSDSESRQGRKAFSDEEPYEESEIWEKSENIEMKDSQINKNLREFSEINKNLNPTWNRWPKKLYSMQKHRSDFFSSKLDADKNKSPLDFVEIGSYLEVFGKIWPMSDDYKIVFISSDSSTRENRSVSTTDSDSRSSSDTDLSKKSADCDWDYFDSSSIVRPVIKDWNWYKSPKSFSETFLESGNSVFSTSDDNSPKFPRRNLGKLSVRDSPISCDTDTSGFSPSSQRKIMDLNIGKFNSVEIVKSDEAKEIKKEDSNASFTVDENIEATENKNMQDALETAETEAKPFEDSKKSKKRRKNKKSRKGNSKDEDESRDTSNENEDLKNKLLESRPVKINGNNMNILEPSEPGPNVEALKEAVNANELSTDGVITFEGSVEKGKQIPAVAVLTSDTDGIRDLYAKGKIGRIKKQKNKKKCDKCGTVQRKFSGPEGSGEPLENEFLKNGDDEKNEENCISNGFQFQTGSFGFQPQNLIPSHSQTPPGVLAYNCPISNFIQNANVYQNFVPIPVPVLIPVPFPVPTTIWSQDYQNLYFPNLNLSSDNFNIFNNFQNFYPTNYQNLVSQPRNDNAKVSFDADENNSTGTGSGSIHMRSIKMQRPELTIGSLLGRSQGSLNSTHSDFTCSALSEQQPIDNETVAISQNAVESYRGRSDDVSLKPKDNCNDETRFRKFNSKTSKSLTDKSDEMKEVTDGEDPIGMNNRKEKQCQVGESFEMILPKLFVEGKTFKDVKNDLRHKNDVTYREKCIGNDAEIDFKLNGLSSADIVSETFDSTGYEKVILIDENVTCDAIESSLLSIDKKSDCSSTSRSEESEEDGPRKPFRKCYYVNGDDSECKTSDDSVIVDLSSSDAEDSRKEENSSCASSTTSEDEGNPDSRFSEVYVINESKSHLHLSNDLKESSREEVKDNLDEEIVSIPRKENDFMKNTLPFNHILLSDDADSDNSREQCVVLLKHVKKLLDEDMEPTRTGTETETEMPCDKSKLPIRSPKLKKRNQSTREQEKSLAFASDKPDRLHTWQIKGAQVETTVKEPNENPVILVPHLAVVEPDRASDAESKIIPGSVHESQLNSNSSGLVFDEIKPVPYDSVVEKIGLSSTAFLNKSDTFLKGSENKKLAECVNTVESLCHADVDGDAKSEIINGDLLIESTSHSSERKKSDRVKAVESSSSKKNSSHLSELKTNRNGYLTSNKIESRIENVAQQDSLDNVSPGNETKYTSLIMITQDKNAKLDLGNSLDEKDLVKVVTTNTIKNLDVDDSPKKSTNDVCLNYTNRKSEGENREIEDHSGDGKFRKREKDKDKDDDDDNNDDDVSGSVSIPGIHKLKSLEEYYTMTLENSRGLTVSPKKPNVIKNMIPLKEEDEVEGQPKEEVHVVTDDKTLSAVICLEEGLADDDSWVEDLEKDRDNDFVNAMTEEDCSSEEEGQIGACIPVHTEREEELRGYHRGAINFTLHTIVEESCEESEVEDKTKTAPVNKRPTSVTELEKYFFFDIGGGVTPNFETQDLDTFSESSSSIYSDSGVIDDTSGEVRESSDQNQLSASRLEKYFLNFDRDGREKESDGSVGSDSEGPPSPEQRRKRLFRARASSRLHSNSLDNLVQSENEQQSAVDIIIDSEGSSTETDMNELQSLDKSDDSVKRKKKRKISGGSTNLPLAVQEGLEKIVDLDSDEGKENRDSSIRDHRHGLRDAKDDAKVEAIDNEDVKGIISFDQESDDERCKTPQLDSVLESGMNRDKQQSRDSGFIGSCDDLLKDQKTGDSNGNDIKKKSFCEKTDNLSNSAESETVPVALERQPSFGLSGFTPPATGLTRKDSFNNWSSDEETNLMMTKMRQFFKAMVSVPKTSAKMTENSNPSSPQVKTKTVKSPQLVYFENELTRLMKTVPGIRDDQVRELVEYLSSEDTWSDSYDSSDYTSSDLEGTAVHYQRTQLQQEISESCKQIIDKFDQSKCDQESRPKVPPRRNSSPMNRETAMVYQKLVASFNKITNENENPASTPHGSPPLFAKVMHHIGSRLVALMHEVSSNSSGEGSISSHKSRYHKRINQKLSNVSSTTEEECVLTDENDYKREDGSFGQNMPYFQLLHQLPRSKSHDLLLEEPKIKSLRSSSSGVSDIAEEKEASDYERFSWRGSFESALMADSRSKLTLLSNESHSSNTTLAAKRRSAGDLLFLKSLSREQLDRVRSCGSIGGVAMEDKNIWTTGRDRNGRRRSSVPDAGAPGSGASADGDEDSSDSEIIRERSITLPRGLQSISSSQNTNSLPRLPTNGVANSQNLSKAQSVQHFLPNAKSARYRPPGFNRVMACSPKRAVSAPGLQLLQPSHTRRERRRNQNFFAGNNTSLSGDELNNFDLSMGAGVPMTTAAASHVYGESKSASPSPIVGSARSRLRRGPSSMGSPDWSATDEIQRLVSLDHQRQSSSSLGARSDSMASVYSGAGEGRSCSIPVKGEVEFGLQYNYKAGDLEIYVKQCKDLAPVDVKRNRSDPYVKVYLLPDKSKSGKRKTKVKKHTLNPIFDEVLKFHISLNGLETRTLWLTVWHSDMFGRNDFLGEVMMSLENKVFDDPTPRSYVLQERTEPFEDLFSYKGEIIIGLKFVPPDASTLQKKGKRSKGALNVKIKEAKNLTAVKGNGVSDPFCKSYLLPDKGRNSKQKTPVQRRTCNPSWNHTFVYDDVSLQELSERCLELTVWDHDRLASNEFLGGLRFSLGTGKHYGKQVDWMDSTGKEVLLWQSMLEKPNLWVEGCLLLRASLDPPNGGLT